ncbi:hypothetical protein FDP41_007312 [Naegleria fowleri]|uniref:JmjC domain-containing protein n=1 Tax=Naegleria fowleri TaxID=5763 RepID=A0A6A5BJY0_NAEFO|nr:uncharacterized protein FDP41_007312 [Naegleria fowleri]KAF0973925.1 hypothetical protein FDP41_007312 [Naegleria fowleri]
MIYVGNSETFTPAHKDVCGALGHNLMVYSDNGRTHAIWCIMKYEDLEQIRIFFQQNGAFLDDDNCFLPLHILSKAPFTVYLFEQKLGDLVLLPPSAPHQVLNMGGKASRKFGKNQVYRIKAVTYYSMLKYSEKSQSFTKLEDIGSTENERKRFSDDMLILLRIFDDILFEESIESDVFDDELHVTKLPETEKYMHSRYCDHCKCDIFNRCFHVAKTKLHQAYDLCINCVAKGRGSFFGDEMNLMEHISFSELRENFEQAKKSYLNVQQLMKNENITTMDDLEKTIWITRDPCKTTSITTIAWSNMYYSKHHKEFPEYLPCHQCDDSKPKYCTKTCTKCNTSYCNQCLWDRYTLTLCECNRLKNWTCPHCNDVCNCVKCLKKRDIDTLSYSTNILSRMDEIKDVLPFSVLDVSGNESTTRILDSICDLPPQPIQHLTEAKNATRILNSIAKNCPLVETNCAPKTKKRKIIIINKNPDQQQIKIIHNYYHHQKVSVCGNCQRSIATTISLNQTSRNFIALIAF